MRIFYFGKYCQAALYKAVPKYSPNSGVKENPVPYILTNTEFFDYYFITGKVVQILFTNYFSEFLISLWGCFIHPQPFIPYNHTLRDEYPCQLKEDMS